MKKHLVFGLKLAVTALLFVLIVQAVDWSDTLDRVRSISVVTVMFCVGLILTQFLLSIWRWLIILHRRGDILPAPKAGRLFFEGQFFNQALPSTVGGDGVRMYRAYRAGLALESAVSSVILDRLFGMTSLVLLVALAQPLFYHRVEDFAARLTFTSVCLLAIAAILVLLGIGGVPQRHLRWRPVRAVVSLSRSARDAFCTPRVVVPVILISLVGHIVTVVVFYLLSMTLGLGIVFLDCLVMVPSIILLATIPVSIAGWGVREGATVAAFSLIGVPAGGAAAMSVLFGFGLIVASLPGGLLWLLNADRSISTPVPTIEQPPVT